MKNRIEFLFTKVLVTGIKLAYDILEVAKNMHLNILIHTKINNMKELPEISFCWDIIWKMV